MTESERSEERKLNYERYRTLVQNEAVGSKIKPKRIGREKETRRRKKKHLQNLKPQKIIAKK